MIKKEVRQGTPGKGERIALHSRSLVREIQDWLELRIALLEVQFWERMHDRRSLVLISLLTVLVSFLAVAFLLVAAALLVGDLLGHDAWGFSAIGVALCLGAWILYRVATKTWIAAEIATVQPTDKNGRTERETIEPGPTAGAEGEGKSD